MSMSIIILPVIIIGVIIIAAAAVLIALRRKPGTGDKEGLIPGTGWPDPGQGPGEGR